MAAGRRRPGRRGPGAGRSPLTSGGLALILTSGITSVLGLPYWVIAARRYSPAEVGVGSALVSAMLLLSSIATAGLKRSLIRFVPESGSSARRLVARTYLFALVAGCGAAAVFVWGVGLWAPELDVLHERPVLVVAFVVGVGAWGLFQLQDSVLVALRRTWVVPLENVCFSVAKIVLLVALAGVVPVAGVYLSWSIPAVVAVVVVNGWLLKVAANPPEIEGAVAPTRRQITRFAGAEHVASLLWHATMHLTPLVVLAVLGAAQNASYYVAAQIAYALYLVSSNVGDVLVAEGAIERRHLHRSLRKAAVQVGTFLLPGVAVMVVGAPWILAAFGGDYRHDATALLRLLALSAVPNTVVSLLVSVAHVRGRLRRVVTLYAGVFVATMVASWLAMGPWGLTGVGWVWVVVQVVAALALGYVTARDEPELVRAGAEVLRVAARRAMAWARGRRARHRLPAGLDRVPAEVRGDHGWTVVSARDDRLVLRRDDDQQLVRAATGLRGVDAVVAHTIGLRALHRDPRLGPTRWLIPELVAASEDGAWMVETTCDGTPGSLLPPDLQPVAREAAVVALDRLHEACATVTVVDDRVLTQWVDAPGRVVARALADPRAAARLEEVLDGLRAGLEGHRVVTSRVHGNLSMDDVLFSDDGQLVTGIVDWEATTSALPELDVLHLLLTERQRAGGGELGRHVVAMASDGLDAAERRLRARTLPANLDLPEPLLVQLTWLHHVSSQILTSRPDLAHGWWVRRNVEQVLDHLVPAPDPARVRRAAPRRLRSADGGTGPLRTPQPATVTLGLGALAVAAWVVGLWGADPGAMTDLGLLSLLSPANGAALGLLLVAFAVEVARARPAGWRLGTPVVLFVAAVHGTPAVLYGTLRYAWAWKHLGIVDYIDRHGSVDPGIDTLGVYHNWPGFFSQVAGLLDLMGVEEPFRLLRWWPMAIELATIPALLFVFSAFSDDRRVRWTGVLLFMVANWVGQDYFSPQSEAFVLYLVLLGVVLHRFPRRVARSRWWESRVERPQPAAWPRPWAGAVLALLAVAIVTSHQITPFMVVVALAALWATRRVRSGWPLVATAGAGLVWVATGARTFVADNLRDLASTVGQPVGNAGGNFVDAAQLSAHQQLVSTMGRLTVAGIVVVAGVAVLRQVWGRRLRLEVLALAASPVLLVVTNDFDGEIVFRTYLFALPFLAWMAADGIWARRSEAPPGPGGRARRAVAVAVVSAVLLSGFLYGYYGKDQWYRFSEAEVAASAHVLAEAPPGTLLVTGTDNYPVQFAGYEDLTYVPIASEPGTEQRAVLDDPATVLGEWLADPRYEAGYVLITRSQRDEADATGVLPRGALTRLERDLRASPRFVAVVDTPDATVFALRAGR
ncbi:MAG TPA: hypothetical protein VEW93_04905 [Acidimicrobiales bacterium]|nr:hypothetical protein [Acidimicrobiales bacterium]